MRKLQTGDLFGFGRVIKASGIREELVSYLQKITTETDVTKVGMTTILMIIEALSAKNAESAFYDVLAPVFEVKASDIESMPPHELFANIKQMAEENDLLNFFDSVFGTLGRN